MAPKKVSSELEAQLSAFHDPFSRLTQHPKIPDGTTPWSFGQASSYVKEVSNKAITLSPGSTVTGSAILEFIVFAGQNTNCTVSGSNFDSTGELSGRDDFTIPFEDMGGLDYSELIPSGTSNSTAYEVLYAGDEASRWRMVSTGIQLKLLNSAEENDGWWEAVRLTDQYDANEWKLTTPGNKNAAGNKGGCIAPSVTMFNEVTGQSLQNQPSYSTGMLKDLHLVQFQLNGSLYKERWTENPKEKLMYVVSNQGAVDANQELILGDAYAATDMATEGGRELKDQFVDSNFDMIYIRCYCRSNVLSSENQHGSRFHLTSVINKEVVYDKDVKESRYMTRTENLGASMMDAHTQLRSLNKFAATPVNI